MLKERAQLVARMTIVSDLVMLVTSFLIAFYCRGLFEPRLGDINNYIWILLPAIPIWYHFLARHNLYVSMRRYSVGQIVVRLFVSHVFCGVAISAIVLFLDREDFSRALILLFVATSFVLLTLQRTLAKATLAYVRRKGYNLRYCMVVGTQEKSKEFLRLVEKHADWGMRVRGVVQIKTGDLVHDVEGHKVLGRLEDLVSLCKDEPVDDVVFCIPKDLLVDIDPYLIQLEELGITVRMVLDFYDLNLYRKDLSFFDNTLPILTFYAKSLDAQQLLMKRVLDVVGGLVGVVLTTLIFPFVAAAIKWEDPGPVFFGQNRVGENGRTFKIWKFRSMYQDAEARKKELLDRNEMNGAIFKIKDDPRVTRVGKFLRKTSLDEFPQFWNVLKGEMSLVGTRPPTPDEVKGYENWQRRRITIKPGVTGMWQVNGRSQIDDFDEIVKLDLLYIDSWNIWLDIRILFKTLWVVFSRQGSC